jgi:hypothetical protein
VHPSNSSLLSNTTVTLAMDVCGTLTVQRNVSKGQSTAPLGAHILTVAFRLQADF